MMIQPRRAFGSGELVSLIKCGFYHYFNSIDPLYQSTYEALSAQSFLDLWAVDTLMQSILALVQHISR